jgi:hypothetical protein
MVANPSQFQLDNSSQIFLSGNCIDLHQKVKNLEFLMNCDLTWCQKYTVTCSSLLSACGPCRTSHHYRLCRPTQLFVFLRMDCAFHVLLCMVPVACCHTQWTLLSLHQLIVVTGINRYSFLFLFYMYLYVFVVLSFTKIVS